MDTNKHESEGACSWKVLFTNLRVYLCKFVVTLLNF